MSGIKNSHQEGGFGMGVSAAVEFLFHLMAGLGLFFMGVGIL
jgi:hypothetical protein